jgi:hypothetical protein
MKGRRTLVAAALVAAFALAACSSGGTTTTPTTPPRTNGGGSTVPTTPPPSSRPTEQPVPAESNPPGDIPDSTVFVPFHADAGAIVIRVPEGWARTTGGSSVTFADKLNSVTLEWRKASSAPTPQSARSKDVPELQRTERAFRLHDILSCAPSCTIPYSTAPIDVRLPAGPAVVITYAANSAPSSVTGKQYRLEVLRFELFKNGQEAILTLSGPVGSDNVDPWRLVSESFRWA